MGEAAQSTENQVPLQEPVPGLESRGPGPHCNCKEHNFRERIIAFGVTLTVMSAALLITTVLAEQRHKCPSADLDPPTGPACPDGWIGYRGKCYYFSEHEGDWASSQNHCSSLNASLAGIHTQQDMDFMVRYKGKFDHWIGLQRDPGQPWKWAHGTEFNHSFPIAGGGECTYLNDEGGVSSSRCAGERYWICTKPSAFTKAKETAVDGGS